jgi:hypothetical protein
MLKHVLEERIMNKRKFFGIGLTLCCLMLPNIGFAGSGCNNGYLLGNYNAVVSSLNLQNVLQAVNGTGTTVTPAGTPATPTVIGFGSNPRSLSGSLPGASRFYFDGNGTIVGASPGATNGATFASAVGSYSVNLDCTASISLMSGASFDAVIAEGGSRVLFIETDSTGTGTVGTLQKGSSCVSLSYPQSYGFSFSGATQAPASTTGTGGTTTAAAAFMPYSVVGVIATDGNGNFALSQTTTSNGAVSRSKGGGTYSVGADCSIKLSFNPNSPSTTANFKAPAAVMGLTTDATGGVLVLQPDQNTTLTGLFIVQ